MTREAGIKTCTSTHWYVTSDVTLLDMRLSSKQENALKKGLIKMRARQRFRLVTSQYIPCTPPTPCLYSHVPLQTLIETM